MIRSDINDHLQLSFVNSSRQAEEMRRHLMLVRTEMKYFSEELSKRDRNRNRGTKKEKQPASNTMGIIPSSQVI